MVCCNRIKNELAEGKIGGYTKYEGDILPIYDAAMKYKEANRDTLVIAGKDLVWAQVVTGQLKGQISLV